ncbi:1-phosphatidylinositol 4,5-bisphosphate phosphodiesterase beta-4 [Branchiostoma belcheri]|nr:1-phosphatidylinositol 4,5-bisphosphate phosphodiesterase beta-4 [Branchiostoma belcheri]
MQRLQKQYVFSWRPKIPQALLDGAVFHTWDEVRVKSLVGGDDSKFGCLCLPMMILTNPTPGQVRNRIPGTNRMCRMQLVQAAEPAAVFLSIVGHKIGGMSGLEPGTSRYRVAYSAVTPHDPTKRSLVWRNELYSLFVRALGTVIPPEFLKHLRTTLCIKHECSSCSPGYISAKQESSSVEFDCTFKTDEYGFFLYWKAEGKGEELLLQFYSVTRNPSQQEKPSRITNELVEGSSGSVKAINLNMSRSGRLDHQL